MVRAKKEIIARVSYLSALKNYFKGYINFKGVATRSEYWYVWVTLFVVNFAAGMVASQVLSSILFAVLFLPSRALGVRRCHDVGISGLWYLVPWCVMLIWAAVRSGAWTMLMSLNYVPVDAMVFAGMWLIGIIALLIVFVMPSKLKNNKYRK